MKIVSPAEMKKMDERAVAEGLFSSVQLMQNAAEALYREVSAWLDAHEEERVLLLAGPGNNGGDAYALACLLSSHYRPAILPLGGDKRSPDCAFYYEKARDLGIPFVADPEGYPLVVDGVFGAGFRGELPGEICAVLEEISAPVIAIDIPSGMDGNSGVSAPGTLVPFLTVTFAFKKPCHLLANCGQVVLADIGIPAHYAGGIPRNELMPVVFPRSDWGHKNTYGSVGLRVGAACYPGAAALALKGALSSGAGLVFAYLPQEIRSMVGAKFYGPVLNAKENLFPLQCDAYLIGSGLGRDEEAAKEVAALWASDRPLVVDGDGLWHLEAHPSDRSAATILTPHMGEFSRLVGCSVAEVSKDRLRLAEAFAAEHHLILVLKDAATVVTDGARTEILSAPSSALAKGGSGDLLAGLVAGLLAGDRDPFEAAKLGVYLHNRAAHLALSAYSPRYLQPEIIADYINHAWMEIENGAI